MRELLFLPSSKVSSLQDSKSVFHMVQVCAWAGREITICFAEILNYPHVAKLCLSKIWICNLRNTASAFFFEHVFAQAGREFYSCSQRVFHSELFNMSAKFHPFSILCLSTDADWIGASEEPSQRAFPCHGSWSPMIIVTCPNHLLWPLSPSHGIRTGHRPSHTHDLLFSCAIHHQLSSKEWEEASASWPATPRAPRPI